MRSLVLYVYPNLLQFALPGAMGFRFMRFVLERLGEVAIDVPRW